MSFVCRDTSCSSYIIVLRSLIIQRKNLRIFQSILVANSSFAGSPPYFDACRRALLIALNNRIGVDRVSEELYKSLYSSLSFASTVLSISIIPLSTTYSGTYSQNSVNACCK